MVADVVSREPDCCEASPNRLWLEEETVAAALDIWPALSEISRERVFAAAGLDVEALTNLREGRPIWHYCLLGALGLLGLEQALTLVWRK